MGFTLGASALVLDQIKNLRRPGVGDVHAHFVLRFWRSLTVASRATRRSGSVDRLVLLLAGAPARLAAAGS